jgi:hypothetical protein
MSDPFYFGSGWPSGPNVLGLINMSDPRLLGSCNHVWPMFFGSDNHIWPVFFYNGQHNFLEGERKGGKYPRPKLLYELPPYMCLATMPEVARCSERHPVKQHSFLFWSCMRHSNGANDAHSLARAQLASTISEYK